MSNFKVGDICIGQNHVLDMHFNGMECVILGDLKSRFGFTTDGRAIKEPAYCIRWANSEVTYVRPYFLRKKRPPQSDDAWAAEMVKRYTKPVEQLEAA